MLRRASLIYEMQDASRSRHQRSITAKLDELPLPQLAEVEDFIDFLRLKGEDSGLALAAARMSESAFERIWDNPADAEYDRL